MKNSPFTLDVGRAAVVRPTPRPARPGAAPPMATTPTPLDGLWIAPSRRAVVAGQGVSFQVEGVSDEMLMRAEFLWDFGEGYDFAVLPADFRGDRNSRRMRGPDGAHVFLTPGEHTVLLTAFDPETGGAVMAEPVRVAVQAASDAYPLTATRWYSNAFAAPADFRAAALAGDVEGITPADAAATPAANFVTDWAALFSDVTGPTRFRLRAGETTIVAAEQRVGSGGYVDRFGPGPRPVLRPSDAMVGGSPSILRVRGSVSDVVIRGVAFEGGYDAANPSWAGDVGGTGAQITATVAGGAITALTIVNGGSGYDRGGYYAHLTGGGGDFALIALTATGGVIDGYQIIGGGSGYASAPTVTVSRPDPFAEWSAVLVTQGGSAAAVPSDVTVFDCAMAGLHAGVNAQAGGAGLFVVGNAVTNWYNYGVYLERFERGGVLGNHIHQKPNAKRHVTGGQSSKNQNAPHERNYVDHGPLRNQRIRRAVVSQNWFESYGGWAGVQSAIRMAQTMWDLSEINAPGATFADLTADNTHSGTVAGNHLVGGVSSIAFYPANDWTGGVRPRYFVFDGNYHEFTKDTQEVLSFSYYNFVMRNSVVYVPPTVGRGVGPEAVAADLTLLKAGTNGFLYLTGPLAPPGSPEAGGVAYEDQGDVLIHSNTVIVDTQRTGDFAIGGTWNLKDRVWVAARNRFEAGPILVEGLAPTLDNNVILLGGSALANRSAFAALGASAVSAFGQPLDGSSALGAASGPLSSWLDFRGGYRPAARARGALERSTDLTGWTALPGGFAPARIAVAFSKPPEAGDVFGVDVTPVVTVVDPGVPPVNPADVQIALTLNEPTPYANQGFATPPSGEGHVLAPFETARLYAQITSHPYSGVGDYVEASLSAAPAATIGFNGTTQKLSGFGSAMAPSRRFTLATVVTLDTDANDHIVHTASTGAELIRLSNGRFRLRLYHEGGGPLRQAVTDEAFPASTGPMNLIFSVDLDRSPGPVRLWINGQTVPVGISVPGPGLNLGFANMTIMGATGAPEFTDGALGAWLWLSRSVALDPATHWTELFDPATGAARPLTATTPVAGVTPDVFLDAADPAEWSAFGR